MLTGSVVPDVCIPTWLGVVFALAAVATLAGIVYSRRHRRRERERAPWTRGELIGAAGLLLSVALAVAGFVHCPEDAPVGISLADSRLNPAEYDDPSDEYVCLVNREDDPVPLTGWELRAAERRINVLPNFTLKPGAAVRVHPGEGTNSPRDLYGEKGSPQWRNEGGQIGLFDNEGQEVDSIGYGERKDGDGSGECGSGAESPLRAMTASGPSPAIGAAFPDGGAPRKDLPCVKHPSGSNQETRGRSAT